jgi:hypothetical protein
MPGTYHTELSDYLNYLPGYDLSDSASEVLEVARQIIDSENYFMRGYVFPINGVDTLGGLDTFEGELAIPSHSVIISMTGFSSQAAGFKIQFYENGSRQLLFGRTYGTGSTVLGSYASNSLDNPIGPAWLTSPLIVIPPGKLNGQVTNLASTSALIQVYLQVAVPITKETLSQNVTKVGRN